MVSLFRMVPASSAARWFLGVLGVLFVGVAALMAYFAWSSQATRFEVSPAGLRITGAYGRMVPAQELAVEGARRVDFSREPELRPTGRTNGVGTPGYLAGWVRLGDGKRGLVYLTDHRRAVLIPTRSDYVLLASVTEPEAFLQALAAPRGVTGFGIPPADSGAVWFTVIIGVVMLSGAGLMAYLGTLSRNVRYEVGPAGVRIVGMYGRMIPVASLQVAEARTVDLSQETSLRPVIRTNGAGLPGLLVGWVRLGNGGKALVFLTDHRRVVHLPTRDGYSVLLSVEEPSRLLEAVKGIME